MIADLTKVPHSSELAGTLAVNKVELKTIIDNLNKDTTIEGCTAEAKKAAMESSASEVKPIQENIKEGLRRIRAVGLKPSKGSETGEFLP